MIQFYLGVINSDLFYSGKCLVNMGEVLEIEPILTDFGNMLAQSLAAGTHMEDAILSFISENAKLLGMTTSLTDHDKKRIKDTFHTQYRVIETAMEFDEFVTIRPKQRGDLWVEHQAAIVCPFAAVINSCFPSLADEMTSHAEAAFLKSDLLEFEQSNDHGVTSDIELELDYGFALRKELALDNIPGANAILELIPTQALSNQLAMDLMQIGMKS